MAVMLPWMRATHWLVGAVLAGCAPSGGESGTGGGSGFGGSAGAGGVAGASNAALVQDWARQVTLGTEYGGDAAVVARWTESPTLSVMAAHAEGEQVLGQFLAELSKLISPLAIDVVSPGDESADIHVFFVPLSDFDAIGEKYGFPIAPGNYGYFYLFWDGNHALTRSYVLLAIDRLQGGELQHFTLEEVTQSFGLANDSPAFADSIFYADGADGGNASALSALDRRLVRFVYSHTQPGDGAAEFDSAFVDNF